MIVEKVNRRNIYDEMELEIDVYTTSQKKDKRYAFETLERLDLLSYHYFSQEYIALKACYINCLCYIKYKKHRYLAGAIAFHVSSMNKTFRNVFFGSEFFGKFRKHMLGTHQIPAKFLTISRFVLFPQFRGIGIAKKFVELATDRISQQPDVLLIEIYSSMLYNLDFMPKDWIKYVNVVKNQFATQAEYVEFCNRCGIVRSLEDAKKVLDRALKHDSEGEVTGVSKSCPQVRLHAMRVLQSAGETEALQQFKVKKRNQSHRQSKQMVRRIPRSEGYVQRKSGSMYNRMNDAEAFVNIASYMFYIPDNKFKYFNEYFFMDDIVNYNGLLNSYKDFGSMYKNRIALYKKNRKKQLPIFLDLFEEFCNVNEFRERDRRLQEETSQAKYMDEKYGPTQLLDGEPQA